MATTAPRDYRRPSRSNSLQKMLELEKQAMVQRQQQAAGQSPVSIPYSKTAPSHRPAHTRARTYSNSNVSYQRQPPPRQPTLPSPSHSNSQRILPLPQLPPLTVHFPDFDHQQSHGVPSPPLSTPSQSSSSNNSSTTSINTSSRRTTLPALTKSLSSTETLAYQLAATPSDTDERQSVCTSPSWEAYARAKQVKKDQKEQREREKEQAIREQKAKRARLSKQPPPLSTSAGFAAAAAGQTAMKFSTKNKSDVTMGVRGPVKERPASVVGLVAPAPEAVVNKREGHTRSGSFSSILRAFDPRKHSDEEAVSSSSSGGFVGGIKLEQEKFEHDEKMGEKATEKAIEAHGMLSVSDIHPALRDGPAWDSSSSPMASDASLLQLSPRGHIPKLGFSQPTHAEERKSHKWRSYIGLKRPHQHHTKHDSKDSAPSAESKRNSKILISGPILSSEAEAKVAETLAKATPHKELFTPPLPLRHVSRTDFGVFQPAVSAAEPVSEAAVSVSPPSPDMLRPRNSGRLAMSRSQRARRQQRRLQQADEHEVPPPPPRRSSKRKSWVALDHCAPPVPRLAVLPAPSSPPDNTPLAPPERPLSGRPSSIQISPPPSPRNQPSSPSFDHDHLSPHSRHHRHSSSLQHSTSSEDSASDYSHSASTPSTPASSRPQSAAELSPVIADIERFFLDDEGPYKNSSSSSSSELKEIPIRQPSIHRRSRDRQLVLDPGFVPQLEIPLETKKGRSFPLVARKPAEINNNSISDVAHLSPGAAAATAATKKTSKDGASKPIAKVFVECCGCKYYHDLPSKLYEAISAADEAAQGRGMTVRCPWCKHGMSRKCCAGLAAMVYVKERLH